jgi:hypothetical protein
MSGPGAAVVAETGDELEANLWAAVLRDAGLPGQVIMRGPAAALGGVAAFPTSTFQVLVRRDNIEMARSLIADLGGADRLSPVAAGPVANPMRIVWLMAAAIGAILGVGLLLRLLAG